MKTFVSYSCWLLLVAGSYAASDVNFYLYTKSNPQTPQQLVVNDVDSVKESNFNNSHQTKILIHRWHGGSFTSSPNGPIREAYLSTGNYNVISVDWNTYAKLNYTDAIKKAPLVGKIVASFLAFLNKDFELSLDSLVVIGHDVGAHVAGFCGKTLKRGKIAGIVGLDPDLIFDRYANPEIRLSSTDANYVETIHTNYNLLVYKKKPISTAAFYANWGRRILPGCGAPYKDPCAKDFSVHLYAAAIRGYSFAPIHKCPDYRNILHKSGCPEVANDVKLGDPTQIEHREGIYNFEANKDAPYGHL